MTPDELLAKVTNVVKEQEEYTKTLIAETLGLRWGKVNLLANVNTTIVLDQPVASAEYVVWRQVLAAGGELTDVVVSNQTINGFDVVAPLAVSFEYLITKPSIL